MRRAKGKAYSKPNLLRVDVFWPPWTTTITLKISKTANEHFSVDSCADINFLNLYMNIAWLSKVLLGISCGLLKQRMPAKCLIKKTAAKWTEYRINGKMKPKNAKMIIIIGGGSLFSFGEGLDERLCSFFSLLLLFLLFSSTVVYRSQPI